MRDQIVSVENLAERRRRFEASIAKRELLLPSSKDSLAGDRFGLVELSYGEGADLDEVRASLREACENAIETEADLGLPSWTFRIAAMLRLFGEDELLSRMVDQLRPPYERTRTRAHDFLLGIDGVWQDENYETATKAYSYGQTWALIEQANNDVDVARASLEKFVRGDWIRANRTAPWYGTHDNVTVFYAGYWCFEGAAIAQMFGINDSALEGNKYYPYDLAHYLDGTAVNGGGLDGTVEPDESELVNEEQLCQFCHVPTDRFMGEEGFWGCRFCFELDLAERRHAAAESQMRYFLEHPTPAKGKKAKLHQATHQYRLKNAQVELEITTRRLARYREIVARRDLYELDLYHFEDRVAWYRHSVEAEQDLQELHKNHRVDSSRDEQLEYLMNELRRAETRLTKFNS